jgi:hypothetical protein
MHFTTITFPDIQLSQRDGHKLRGYFSGQFGRESDLWHNHTKEGKPIYRYPLIQYKVIDKVPRLIGLDRGAQLLIDHFLKVHEIRVDELVIPVNSKQIKSESIEIGVQGQLFTYRFATPWFALNQKNHREFLESSDEKYQELLNRKLISNMLSFMSEVGYREEQHILTQATELKTVKAKFKGILMTMFKGKFVTNVILPSYIGLGKSVSRGYGTIIREI